MSKLFHNQWMTSVNLTNINLTGNSQTDKWCKTGKCKQWW